VKLTLNILKIAYIEMKQFNIYVMYMRYISGLMNSFTNFDKI